MKEFYPPFGNYQVLQNSYSGKELLQEYYYKIKLSVFCLLSYL